MRITSRGIIFSLTAVSIFITAAQAADQKKIRIGFNPGPYKEQFEKGVAPLLIKQGYTLEYKDFSDGIQVNDAVHRGTIGSSIQSVDCVVRLPF